MPIDLHNVCSRIIVPHAEGKREAVIEANNGNLTVAQALLRRKSEITTAVFYKKAITPDAFKSGMKPLEAAANGNGSKD